MSKFVFSLICVVGVLGEVLAFTVALELDMIAKAREAWHLLSAM